MNFIAALLLFPVGVAFGALLVVNFSQVLGWGLFSASALTLLPPPLNVLAQSAISAFGVSLASLIVALVLVFLCVFFLYWIASAGTTIAAMPGPAATGDGERFGRGGLVGLNSGMNLSLMLALWGLAPAGPLVTTILTLVNFLSCLLLVSSNPIYQIILAYTSLALPMTWPINLAGMVVATVNAAAALGGAPLTVFAEWTRANYVMHGGIIHGNRRTAYNMCHFTVAHPDIARSTPYFDPGTPVSPFFGPYTDGMEFRTVDGRLLHETAHCLNVGVFGWIYHLIGWVDEEFLPMPWSGGAVLHANALAELCAESGRRKADRNWIDMWAPVTAASNSPAAAIAVTPDAAGVVAVTAFRVACERNRGVVLNSINSTDPDAAPFPLGRLWMLADAPAGSTAAIIGPNAVAPTFTPDIGGRYSIDLFVTDGADGSQVPVVIDALQAAIAVPAGVSPITPGTAVALTSVSVTPTSGAVGGAALAWEIVAAPPGSALLGVTDTVAAFTFTPDLAGPYDIRLTVEQRMQALAGPPDAILSDSVTVTI